MATKLKLKDNNLYANGYVINLEDGKKILKRDKGKYTYAVALDRTHVVSEEDTIWDLADFYYGDCFKYHIIADANPTLIFNPLELPIGSTLIIPEYNKFKLENR